MARTTKNKYYRKPRDKYSIEQTLFGVDAAPGTTTVQTIVPATDVQGMRKVKHLTIQMSQGGAQGILWALFYLPAGMTAPGFNVTSGASLVEPNQFVMQCGIMDQDSGPNRIYCPIARNLNSGDSIVLLLRPVSSTTTNCSGLVRYAITLQ